MKLPTLAQGVEPLVRPRQVASRTTLTYYCWICNVHSIVTDRYVDVRDISDMLPLKLRVRTWKKLDLIYRSQQGRVTKTKVNEKKITGVIPDSKASMPRVDGVVKAKIVVVVKLQQTTTYTVKTTIKLLTYQEQVVDKPLNALFCYINSYIYA